MPVSKKQLRAEDTIWQAERDVTIEPIGAGFRTVWFDKPTSSWRTSPEKPYQVARETRARRLAAKALEMMGADTQDAEDVAFLLPAPAPAPSPSTA